MLMPSGCKDIGIRKFKFVAKTQFLCQPLFISENIMLVLVEDRQIKYK